MGQSIPQLKIYVISLPESVERRTQIARQLGALGLDFEFFDAIEASQDTQGLFDGHDRRGFLRNTGRQAQCGEIGCFASHRAVWGLCRQMDEPVVVLEDDALLAPDFALALVEIRRLIGRCGFIRLQDESRARSRPIVQCDSFSLCRYTKMTQGAMGYAIGPAVAAVFITESRVFAAPVDVFIRRHWVHRQPLYGLKPYTVSESAEAADSTIGERVKAKRSLTLRLARLAGKAGWFGKRSMAMLKPRNDWTRQ